MKCESKPQRASPNVVLPWCSIHQLRDTVSSEHSSLKQKELDNMPKASLGYGGKFGVQQDRMDKVGPELRQPLRSVKMLSCLCYISLYLSSCVFGFNQLMFHMN